MSEKRVEFGGTGNSKCLDCGRRWWDFWGSSRITCLECGSGSVDHLEGPPETGETADEYYFRAGRPADYLLRCAGKREMREREVTPERKKAIEDAAAIYSAARMRLDMMSARNVAFVKYEERIKMDQEYAVAQAEFYDAKYVLNLLLRPERQTNLMPAGSDNRIIQ